MAKLARIRSRTPLIGGLVLAVTVAAGSAWLLWSRHEADREDREIAALKLKLETSGGGGDADEHYRLGLHQCEQEGAAEGLALLELAAEKAPSNLVFGNAVRIYGMRFKEYDRSIRFFERLVAANGDRPEPRVQLALAYVDKMPDHMMGIVGQGKLSKQSISILTGVLDAPEGSLAETTHWAALYALGMNHLYWPKALRHATAAEDAFRRCLDFQKTMHVGEGLGEEPPTAGKAERSLATIGSSDTAGARPSDARSGTGSPSLVGSGQPARDASAADAPLPAYFVLPFLGLGDALVKEGRPSEARAVWKEALQSFPKEPRLAERLVLSDEQLTDLIDRARGLAVVVDTDLSILWGRRP